MLRGTLRGSHLLAPLTLLAACNDPVGLPKAPPLRQAVIDVATAMGETCALTGDHRTFCWISDSLAFHASAVPWLLNTPEPLVGLEAGSGVFSGHFCGQAASGAVYCWGLLLSIDVSAPIGDGRAPVKIGDGFLLGSLAVGSGHACALGPDSTARCWGSYLSAKRGVAGPYPASSPFTGIGWADLVVNTADGGERFVALAAGDYHACGIRPDRTVACWGDSAAVGAPLNAWLHDGDTCLFALACRSTPVLVGSLSGADRLASGSRHTCAIAAGGSFCWGSNSYQQFGSPDASLGAVPAALQLPIAPVQITTGGRHTCGLSASGIAWCVGDNTYGQLGGGFLGQPAGATRVRFAGQFVQLSAGANHTCGIDSLGRLYCWGDVYPTGSLEPWASAVPVRLTVPE